MKGIQRFIQNHRKGCIVGGGIFFGILLTFFIIVFIMPSFNEDNYGNRLKNESKYKISASTVDDIKDTISSEDGVSKVTYHKDGRVLNFTITVEDGVVLDTAKKYAEGVTSKLSEKNLKYYDVQVFLNGNDDIYPIIGYHAKESSGFSWGNVGENSEK